MPRRSTISTAMEYLKDSRSDVTQRARYRPNVWSAFRLWNASISDRSLLPSSIVSVRLAEQLKQKRNSRLIARRLIADASFRIVTNRQQSCAERIRNDDPYSGAAN